MSDDPLKHTPACELDRDNRVMTREDEGVRAVMESLRADNERLRAVLREALLYDSQIIHMES